MRFSHRTGKYDVTCPKCGHQFMFLKYKPPIYCDECRKKLARQRSRDYQDSVRLFKL